MLSTWQLSRCRRSEDLSPDLILPNTLKRGTQTAKVFRREQRMRLTEMVDVVVQRQMKTYTGIMDPSSCKILTASCGRNQRGLAARLACSISSCRTPPASSLSFSVCSTHDSQRIELSQSICRGVCSREVKVCSILLLSNEVLTVSGSLVLQFVKQQFDEYRESTIGGGYFLL